MSETTNVEVRSPGSGDAPAASRGLTKAAERPSDRVAPWRVTAGAVLSGRPVSLIVPGIAAALLVLFPLYDSSVYWTQQLSLIAVLGLVVSGVNLSFGYAGEVQFGQVFMFALGAYLPMVLATHGTNDVVLLMAIGGCAAALVGLLIALPALRIGGWSLAMASFFLVVTIPDLASIFSKYTGGLNGLVGIPQPDFFGHSLGTTGLYEVAIVVTIIWMVCYRNLVTSRYGVVFRVLRESPILSQSLGFSSTRLKTLAYVLGALPAGIAGCLFGYISLVVQPSSFGLDLAIGTVAASVLGGIESVYGCLAGAAILQLGPEQSVSFASYAPVAYGLFLLVAAVILRKGLGGIGRSAALRLARQLDPRLRRHASANTPEDTFDEGGHPVTQSIGDLLSMEGQRLEVSNIFKSYGGVRALDGVSLVAEPGEVTALIGSNGSGKTTLLNVSCGFTKADSGTVTLGGRDVTGESAHRVAHLGIGRTFQTPTIPRGVPVREVVASGRYYADHCGPLPSILRLPKYRASRREDRREADAILEMLRLSHLAEEDATLLPLGTRRLVEVARALCGGASLLLLDEPASGLSDEEVRRLAALLAAVARAGGTVVVIEHNFEFVTNVADRVHVLHLGTLLASGHPAELSQDPRVVESYLGRSVDDADERIKARHRKVSDSHDDRPELAVEHVSSGYGDIQVLRDVSINVKRGTISLVLGRNGAGKTSLLNTITGTLPTWDGAIRLDGKVQGRNPPYRRAASGIALVQEGKRIFRHRTIRQNVLLGTYSQRMSRTERNALCESVLAEFPALASREGELAGGLSGGQQQMLAIAQALASKPKVLLLDEPSAGLAPAIVAELFDRVRALADSGLAVLLVEQLAEVALEIADEVTVIDSGRVTAHGSPEIFKNRDDLQRAYFGGAQTISERKL